MYIDRLQLLKADKCPVMRDVCPYYDVLTYHPSLLWRHHGHNGVSNHHHQSRDCLFNRLFRRRSRKTSNLRITGLCMGNPGSRKMFPFDDVIVRFRKTFMLKLEFSPHEFSIIEVILFHVWEVQNIRVTVRNHNGVFCSRQGKQNLISGLNYSPAAHK